MKKLLFITVFTAIAIALFYFFAETEEVVLEIDDNPKVENTKIPTKQNIKVEDVDSLDSKSTEEFETAQFDKYLEQVEDEWNQNIEKLFLKDSENDKNLQEYLKLKNGYEEERETRYEEFHKMMEAKHGSNYSYSPSADEEMFNEKLVKIYETNLSKIIGKEKMIEYLKVKDTFNRKLEEDAKSSDSYILIEF